MELVGVVALALVVALLTLLLCDLAGSVARAKGRSYWGLFALGLLLWFPALLTALLLPDRTGSAGAAAPVRRGETAVAVALLVLAALSLGAAVHAAVSYAP